MSSSDIPTDLTKYLTREITAAMDTRVRLLAEQVLERAKADAPPSPPAGEDPDPAVSLRDSGHVRRVGAGRYEIVFDAPYAAKQHESLRFEHPRGGKPKFLEAAVREAAAELPVSLAGAMIDVTHATRQRRRAVT